MKVLSLLACIIITANSIGQIWSNPITGTNPNTSNPYTIGQTVNGSITVSGIGRGPGINGTNANDRYNTNTWNTVGISLTSYFDFTLTPNATCLINFTNFVYTGQASGSGPTNFAIRSSLDGFTTNIGTPTATGTTINLSAAAYQNISTPITFRFYAWGASGSGGTFSINDFAFNGTVSCGGPANTITPGTISGGPFNVDCNGTSATGSIAYTSTGTFAAGNTFTVQLSNASGSFSSPLNIGTTATTAGSGSLSFTIPSWTLAGSGYRIRIISSNPATTSTNSAAFTINQAGGCVMNPPYVSSLIYDGCDGTCGAGSEGLSEIVFGNTGSYSLYVNSANVDLNYTTAGYNMTTTVTNNTTTTSALNTAASCPGLFVNSFNTTIPPNSTFLMVSEGLCVDALTWLDLCGQGPIYLIYGGAGTSGNTWHNSGNFGNSGGAKNYSTSFVTNGGTFNMNYTYTAPGSGTDGNYATYAIGSGTPATQGNFPNCTVTPIVLASELLEYSGKLINSQSLLTWKTASERNNATFTIQHSTNGLEWNSIGILPGAGTIFTESNYELIHEKPETGINYYKLLATDFDGEKSTLGIVLIKVTANFAYFNQSTNQVEFNNARSIRIVSMDGKIVAEKFNVTELEFYKKGVFIIQDLNTLEMQRFIAF